MAMITPLVRRALAMGAVVAVLGGAATAAAAPSSTEPPAPPSEEFCDAAWQIRDAATTIDELSTSAAPDADDVRLAYEQLATATADATAAAPPDLADGLDLLAGQAGVALAVVEANHFDLTALEADPRWEALGEFDQLADLSQYEADVESSVEANCPEPTAPSTTA